MLGAATLVIALAIVLEILLAAAQNAAARRFIHPVSPNLTLPDAAKANTAIPSPASH